MKLLFNFEVYMKHPVTGEEGWEIKFVSVLAETKDAAKDILKTVSDFDCVILFNRSYRPDAHDSIMIESGCTFWETNSNYFAISTL